MTGADQPQVWGLWNRDRVFGNYPDGNWAGCPDWAWSFERAEVERRQREIGKPWLEVRPVPDIDVAAYPEWAGRLLAALELQRARLLLQQAMDGEA